MKKTLGIFLMLLLVTGAFATEPVADVKFVEIGGSSSVTFGVDLNTGLTGFKNDNAANIKFNFYNGGTRSTTGEGIWGELQIKVGDPLILTTDKLDTVPSFADGKLAVEVAQIHFGPVYMGIKGGVFELPGINFPNALRYANDGVSKGLNGTDGMGMANNAMGGFTNFTKGFNLGFKIPDMLTIDVSLKSRPNAFAADTTELKSVSHLVFVASPGAVPGGFTVEPNTTNTWYHYGQLGVVYFAEDGTATVDYDSATNKWTVTGLGTIVKATYGLATDATTDNFWSGNYALGASLTLTPITGLKVAAAIAVVLSDTQHSSGTAISPINQKGDMQINAGVEYKLSIGEKYSVTPVLGFNMDIDASKKAGVLASEGGEGAMEGTGADEKTKYNNSATTNFGIGVNFGWGAAIDDGGIINGFFGSRLATGGDQQLLPGVAVYTNLNLTNTVGADPEDASKELKTPMMDSVLPILLTLYTGTDLVPNLNVAALFYANIASKAGHIVGQVGTDQLVEALGHQMQIGLAASYAIAAGDITITPALGILFDSVKLVSSNEVQPEDGVWEGKASAFGIDLKVDIAGLVPNTTFNITWDNASFVSTTAGDQKSSPNTKGAITVTAKIAF